MKIRFRITVAFVLLSWCVTNVLSQQNSNGDHVFLTGVQNQIEMRFLEAMKDQEFEPLLKIKNRIDRIDDVGSSTLNYYKSYWSSYLLYHLSLCYFRNEQLEMSERVIKEAIDILEDIENKDSEVLALLALAQTFYFQYVPRQDVFLHMHKVKENLKKSMILDKNNMRAHYVNASYDYYTPEEYGGGQRSESLLLKALATPSNTSSSPFAPNWGKKEAYGLLIGYYIKKANKESASKYLSILKNRFPEYGLINSYSEAIEAIN